MWSRVIRLRSGVLPDWIIAIYELLVTSDLIILTLTSHANNSLLLGYPLERKRRPVEDKPGVLDVKPVLIGHQAWGSGTRACALWNTKPGTLVFMLGSLDPKSRLRGLKSGLCRTHGSHAVISV